MSDKFVGIRPSGRCFFIIVSIFLFCFADLTTSIQINFLGYPVSLGESPYWDVFSQKLIYLDYSNSRIVRYDPLTNSRTTAQIPNYRGCNAVIGVEGSHNQFIVACGKDINLVYWDGENDVFNPPTRRLASYYSPFNSSFNDAKCDESGRLWAGTIGEFDDQINVQPFQGNLYSMGPELLLKIELGPISLGNGLTWNANDSVMYYIDSFSYQVWAFDFNVHLGLISNKRVVFDLKAYNFIGIPDGMTIDTNDNLWIACFGEGGVANVDPRNGKLLQFIRMPVNQVASLAFGGPSMDILYVTTGNVPTANIVGIETQNQTNAGSLFSIEGLGVQGYPHNRFKLNFLASSYSNGY